MSMVRDVVGPLPLGEMGSYEITTVSMPVGHYFSMSLGKHFFSKTPQDFSEIPHKVEMT